MLRVSSSGFYAWLRRPESPRNRANRTLTGQIRAAHRHSRQTYGRRRIHIQLQRQAVGCSPNRVGHLIRQEGLQGIGRRKFRATTDSRHSFPVAPNLLARDFTATAPDQIWVSDITYLRTEQGWDYLATVMDLYSRRIVGWAMQSSLQRSLILRALQMAVAQRRPGPGLIHHSDRGRQYACGDYQEALQRRGMRPSMSRKGDCWDNACMESFFGSLKTEWTSAKKYKTRNEAEKDIFKYIEVFYNRKRRHAALGYLSPAAYEEHYERKQQLAA